jgi:hypothetical protein
MSGRSPCLGRGIPASPATASWRRRSPGSPRDSSAHPGRQHRSVPDRIGVSSQSHDAHGESDWQAELDVGQNPLDHPSAKVSRRDLDWGSVGQQQMWRVQPLSLALSGSQNACCARAVIRASRSARSLEPAIGRGCAWKSLARPPAQPHGDAARPGLAQPERPMQARLHAAGREQSPLITRPRNEDCAQAPAHRRALRRLWQFRRGTSCLGYQPMPVCRLTWSRFQGEPNPPWPHPLA